MKKALPPTYFLGAIVLAVALHFLVIQNMFRCNVFFHKHPKCPAEALRDQERALDMFGFAKAMI